MRERRPVTRALRLTVLFLYRGLVYFGLSMWPSGEAFLYLRNYPVVPAGDDSEWPADATVPLPREPIAPYEGLPAAERLFFLRLEEEFRRSGGL